MRERWQLFCTRLLGVLFVEIEISKDLRAGSLGSLELLVDGAHAFERSVGFEKREYEGEEDA